MSNKAMPNDVYEVPKELLKEMEAVNSAKGPLTGFEVYNTPEGAEYNYVVYYLNGEMLPHPISKDVTDIKVGSDTYSVDELADFYHAGGNATIEQETSTLVLPPELIEAGSGFGIKTLFDIDGFGRSIARNFFIMETCTNSQNYENIIKIPESVTTIKVGEESAPMPEHAKDERSFGIKKMQLGITGDGKIELTEASPYDIKEKCSLPNESGAIKIAEGLLNSSVSAKAGDSIAQFVDGTSPTKEIGGKLA